VSLWCRFTASSSAARSPASSATQASTAKSIDASSEAAIARAWGGLLLGALEQVAVTVERDRHRGVAEERRQGPGVDGGGVLCGLPLPDDANLEPSTRQ
jgi:hypothetical protein